MGAFLDDVPVDLFACESVEQPEEFSGFGFLSVLTFNEQVQVLFGG